MNTYDTIVLDNKMVSENYTLLKVQFTDKNPNNETLPGQFYHIQVNRDGFGLRTPISIFDIKDDTVIFLVKIVGQKTQRIALLKPNSRLNLLGPLGNPFTTYLPPEYTTQSSEASAQKKVLFVTGGVGYAPLNLLHKLLSESNSHITWIHGGRTSAEVKFPSDEKKAQIICTDDGSFGKAGFVTDEVKNCFEHEKYDRVFACGPTPMMKAVNDICQPIKIPLIVSLEEYMGCGVGVCFGCATKIRSSTGKESYVRVCKDGPVFNAKSITWEN